LSLFEVPLPPLCFSAFLAIAFDVMAVSTWTILVSGPVLQRTGDHPVTRL
jgi:hypothetical protein